MNFDRTKPDIGAGAWQFWIDRGGTFTDVIGRAPDGGLHVRKVLSAPSHPPDAPRGAPRDEPGIAAIRGILAAAPAPARIAELRIGTTVATNALLERRGAATVLVTTRGLGDHFVIRQQQRPDLFALRIERPAPLHAEVIEARERVDAQGAVLEPLDEPALEAALRAARVRGMEAAAIVFLHGWQHPGHERRAVILARRCGFAQVSASHAVAPLVRFVARGETTVLDAYLMPCLSRYVATVAAELAALDPRARLLFMQSGGGLAAAPEFRAAAAVLSGPAGGLAGMAKIGTALGLARLIGFDMGGTSTDVSLLDGELPRLYEQEIGGVHLQAPLLDIHSIAAGGGSRIELRDGRLQVGPRSAGAAPGPACYGRGGPLALTDLQVALGRLQPAFLPRVFGPEGSSPLDAGAATAGLAALAAALPGAAAEAPSAAALAAAAAAALEVAVESMANAIRQVAARRGADPADFALFCFGGAAGQHACRVAVAAGMRRIVVHPLASVLCAFGIGVADRLALRRESFRERLAAEALGRARARLVELAREAALEVGAGETERRGFLELRAGERETALDVELDFDGASDPDALRTAFHAAHRTRFGHEVDAGDLVVESLRAEVRAATALERPRIAGGDERSLPASARAWFDGWVEAPVHDARSLRGPVRGPALLVEPTSTLVLERDWIARRGAGGELLLEHAPRRAARPARRRAPGDPARIEIFNALFMHVAEEMGAHLRQTAQSVNIRERLDYSCALFDAAGRLIANAPHMPVHLGSMGASVRAVLAAHRGTLRPGDAWMLNSPYHGGTHLPDVTVVTPVFLDAVAGPSARPDFLVASRAHHADIGGVTPGSMPPFSRSILEEGVLFEDFQLVAAGRFRERELRAALAAGPWPTRNGARNVADLEAQLAANARGAVELRRAVARHGRGAVRGAMREVRANAAECVRQVLAGLASGRFGLEMDGGQRIAVRIEVDRAARRATIDFAGTSAAGPHNFNAPRSVTYAAVLYVFRTLLARPLPLNEGCLEPLEIRIPRGSMLDPAPPAAVVAGNVETSQCIVDVLYGALGVLAASQGTMNNFTFGDDRLQYYETIGGGAGAGPGFEGCDAVQTHMTNSRITDPEILETRFPVLVREFAIRRGSGGSGRYRGGDGSVRRLEFRAALSGAMLANRRRTRPFGLAGGGDGLPGRTTRIGADGRVTELEACARFEVGAGDVIEIRTPGGGGWGVPD